MSKNYKTKSYGKSNSVDIDISSNCNIKRGFVHMNNLPKKLSALVITTMFASMQIVSAAGLADANIISGNGGYQGMTTGTNSATLNFNGNSHVTWGKLNVGSNETLNFNAINGANNITVLNTVTGGQMSHIYGTINSNEGIGQLIISNPSGMLYDGAHFNAAGDVMLTTQMLDSVVNNNGRMTKVIGVNEAATKGIKVKDSSLISESLLLLLYWNLFNWLKTEFDNFFYSFK